MKEFTREYFREELLRFRGWMGSAEEWKNLEQMARRMGALLYLAVRTELDEDDKTLLQATCLEYDRRLLYVMFR